MNSLSLFACYVSIVLIATSQIVLSRPNINNHNNNNNAHGHMQESNQHNDSFDYLIFRQIWPESSCMYPGEHSCSIAKNISTWVVHGLWPSIKSEIGPAFCQKIPFNFDSIKWLLPNLLEFWPNLYTDTPLSSFWEHEWTKHGTCAVNQVPNINNESDYFNVTLALRDHFDFGPILKASNIVPDDLRLYDLAEIKTAIKSVLNVEPMIVCYILKDSDVQYLSQMQICLSKTYELVDCAFDAVELVNIVKDNTPQETQCQSHMPVHYPVIKYSNQKSNQ
jgi:ribonuclease T2